MRHGHDGHLGQMLEHLQRKTALLADRVTLLEEENNTLAEMLREHGVDIHRRSHIHLELPPAFTTPAPGNAEELALLTKTERALFEELCGTDTVLLLLLSESMVDVGRWLMQSRLWVAASRTELAMFAAGRRPFVQRIPFRHIQASLYNHVTGELVLAPNRKFKISRIRMAPVEGYQFLAQILSAEPSKETPHA